MLIESKRKKHILCAVRGVPKSRETATAAIELALKHDARLTFTHITSVDFLASVTTMVSYQATVKQLHGLSEFAMLVLVDRAQRRGVKEVDYVIRTGPLIEELKSVTQEIKPNILVIGQPITDGALERAIDERVFDEFIEDIKKNAGTEVITVEIELP